MDIVADDRGQIEPGTPHGGGAEPPATQAPVPPPATEPPATEAPTTEPPASLSATPPKPTKAPWFMDRIGEETAKRQAAERELADTRRQLEATRMGATSPTTAAVVSQPQVPEDAVQAEVARREFAAKTRSVREAGNAEFGADKFLDAMNGYSILGDEPQVAQFIESALETDAPHKVLHFLGTNQEEGKRIMSLPARRQAIEMERLAAKLTSAPDEPVSRAPAPIKPVGGSGGKAETDPSKMDTKAWMEWRDADVKAKREKGIRIH